MKKCRKKFLEGGKIHNYVEDPTKAIYDNNLMIDKAIIQASQDTELMRTIGDSLIGLSSQVPGAVNGFKKTFRTGGKVPVEIEGQEVVETPAGQLFQAQGPSHENGGIDLSLPEGTDIFSKRISIDGKSMADRKLARERTNKKLEKRSKYNPIEKNTFKRVKAQNDMEEMLDMSIMQAAFNAKNAGERQVAATGIKDLQLLPGSSFGTNAPVTLDNYLINLGVTPTPESKKYYGDALKIKYTGKNDNAILTGLQNFANKNVAESKASDKLMSKIPLGSNAAIDFNIPEITATQKNILGSQPNLTQMIKDGKFPKSVASEDGTPDVEATQFPFSTGDLLGMAGNLYQAYTNKKSAEAEIATDQPNINPYENFGNDALDANSQSMKFVTQMMDRALKNAGLEANSAQKRGRGMSRSANTARAMDISISGNKVVADSKIYDAFAQQMMQLMGQKAQLENQQDAYTMQGREKQDLNDRADKAARFATMRDADMNIGKAISGIGSNFNTAKSRTATEKLINSMSMFGKYNSMTGEMTFDSGKADAMIADGTWKTWKHPKTGLTAKTPEEFKAMVKTI